MTENVLKVVPPQRDAPNPECIKALEGVMERAKSGEAAGVVVIEQGPDGEATWSWGGFCGSMSMLGTLQVVQQTLVLEHIDGDR